VFWTLVDANNLGPMLWFFKYFRRKILRKKWRFWLKTKQILKNVDHYIGI
jgi:hypothetical protein